jgi:hypothetical protein
MNMPVKIRKSPGIASPAEGAIERRDDLDDIGPRERIMDALSIAARLDKIVRAQSRELLRHGRLAQLQNLLKLVDGLFSVDQQTKNEKTSLVRNCLKEIARLSRVVEHGVGVDWRL